MIAMTDTRLTHSQIQTCMSCPRKHFISYILGLRPDRDAKALRIGSVFHAGLEHYINFRMNPELKAQFAMPEHSDADAAVIMAMHTYDLTAVKALDDETDYWTQVEREMIGRMISGTFWRWQEMDEQLEFLAGEQKFEVPIVNPDSGRSSRNYTLAGKIDAIVKLSDGRTAVMEHKTTSSSLEPDSDYWQRLRIDQQISLYYLAALELGYKIDVILYNVTRKPEIYPKKIEILDENKLKVVLDAEGQRVYLANGKPRQAVDTKHTELGWKLQTRKENPLEFGDRLTNDIGNRPEFYFARHELPRTEVQLRDARKNLWQKTKYLHENLIEDRWPQEDKACLGFGRCPYFLLCVNGWNHLSGETPEGFVKVDNVHQELED